LITESINSSSFASRVGISKIEERSPNFTGALDYPFLDYVDNWLALIPPATSIERSTFMASWLNNSFPSSSTIAQYRNDYFV
jgi:hypothetical protein